MRWVVVLALAACKFTAPTESDDTLTPDADPASAATNLRWDTTTIPTALWDPALTVETQELRLFSDTSCVTALGPAIPLAGGDAAFPMPATIGGAMAFSIETITASGTVSSGCSPDVGACPTNYVQIDTNAYTGGSFCLGKYEMRDIGGVAQPIYPMLPRGDITKPEAIAACAARGARYHLATNAEWMATAREIEANTLNWSTTAIPFLKKGHTDDCAAAPVGAELASSTDDDPCFGTIGPQCTQSTSGDFHYNRTFVLSSGAVIWDFSGNSFELLDHPDTVNPTQGEHPGQDINSTSGAAFTPALLDSDYKSADTTQSDLFQSVGVLFREQASSAKLARGGDFCSFAGIYSVTLLTTEVHHNVGFRCAYDD